MLKKVFLNKEKKREYIVINRNENTKSLVLSLSFFNKKSEKTLNLKLFVVIYESNTYICCVINT